MKLDTGEGVPLQIRVEYNLIAFGKSLQPIGDGLALPPEYVATVDDPSLPFEVKLTVGVVGKRVHIKAISLNQREDDPPIAARALRNVPVARFLQASVVSARLRIDEPSPGHYRVWPLRDQELTEQEWTAAGIAARRRTRTTDPDEVAKEVKQAALLYEQARTDADWRRRPTLYVAETMNVSRAKASRLLKRAREQHEEG